MIILTQQFWLVQPLFTGIFFALGIILFFQLIVRSTLRHYNHQRQKIDKIDFSVGRLKLISVAYFSCLAIFFEYSAANVRNYVAFINFRLLLLIFVIVFLGLRSSLIIAACDILAHLVFYQFSIETFYHAVFIVTMFAAVYLMIAWIRHDKSSAAWIIPGAEGLVIIIWFTVHFINIRGVGTIGWSSVWFNSISFLLMEMVLFYSLSTLFHENQQLLTVTRQASIDSLTKLKNYNVFNKEYTHIFEQAGQANLTLTMLEMDIDRFKNINDHYGHLAGNEVLIQVGMVLKRLTEQVDHAACYRTGGEEFSILLPRLSVVEAGQFAQRLQTELDQLNVAYNHEVIKVTASVGIATLRNYDKNADHLFERADRMLYLSKGRGRNLVTTDETSL
ncbi:GGDEF domain-containing protein [Loigolactobacillus binensis]|uniref:GGDEF domain-containing protein n=1 Tax=Loigolactobacillus binensis TaxID=2559922 RepID=UPI0010F9FC7B|nr:GGDEF domain-containing protein [Loigolactobacillus binensis]